MNSTDSLDVLILIALTEEAEIFHDLPFYPLKEQPRLDVFPFHTFEYKDANGSARRGALFNAGEIGLKIRDAATRFSSRFRPKLVLNVGISGRIKDAKVGDVVVPSHINVVDYRAAAQDDEKDGYEILPGGKPATVSIDASSIVTSVPFKKKNKLPDLLTFAATYRISLTADERKKLEEWKTSKELADTPLVVSGPFAVSNLLIKSNRFKEHVLKNADRNFVAADMESGLIADGLLTVRPPPPFYAVRSISDPATSKKSEYDAVGNGLIRRWAMSNALDTVKLLISDPILFGDERKLSPPSEGITDDYVPKYPGQKLQNSISASDFDDRFANMRVTISKRDDGDALKPFTFSELSAEIQRKPRGGSFLVQGRGGGGKTALLRAIQLTIENSPAAPRAIFLDARKVREDKSSPDITSAVSKRIERDAPGLLGSDSSAVVLLDGLVGNDDERRIIDATLQLLANNEPTLVLAFGLDHYELAADSNDFPATPYLHNIKHDRIVDLKAISINDEALALSVIRGIVKTSGTGASESPEVVLAALRALGFLYLNHFVVSIYLHNAGKVAFERKNSTAFVIQSMENLHKELGGSSGRSFNLLCVAALRSYCRNLVKGAGSHDLAAAQSRYEDHFAHFPRVVQTALIAKAVVYILGEFGSTTSRNSNAIFKATGIDDERFLKLVFGNDVNSAVKDLMADGRVEDAVLSAAHKISDTLEPASLSYALYLFGRARSERGKLRGEKAFETASQLLLDPATVSSNEQTKFWRLARRSLYISRSLNGDRKATDLYIATVISDPYEDRLNRSFHLEYYRDLNPTGVTVALDHEDQGENWRRTRQLLGRRIQAALTKGTISEYDRICVLTYFSLVRFRHELGRLSSEQRKQELDLAKQLRARNLPIGRELSAFMTMVEHALSRDVYTALDAVIELFAMKAIPRIGWVERKMTTDKLVIESVASHVYGAMLLADVLSDRITPKLTDDDRNQIIRILLYHDIAEAYIGDYHPMDGAAKAKELPTMHRIAALATYQHITRLSHSINLFQKFETDPGRCAVLARDFDKLDAVFQALMYADSFPSVENRQAFVTGNKERITDPTLREIAEELSHRIDNIALRSETSY
ncbi:5'-deoxynucleotidase YfbR-like HD superfamily hydrolase/nucleoside phosphorylase [Bradyrhizobium diazoefficiens]